MTALTNSHPLLCLKWLKCIHELSHDYVTRDLEQVECHAFDINTSEFHAVRHSRSELVREQLPLHPGGGPFQ